VSADNLVAGILVIALVVAFVVVAFTDDAPAESGWSPRPGVPEASWSNVLGEDLPPMPIARVEDVPALAWDVETGEVVEPRQLGDGSP